MANDVILYRTDDGESAIELHLDNGTVWLTQQELAELFQTSKQNISKHIKAIFEDGELSEEARVWDKSLTLNIKSEQNELSDTQNSVLFAFLSNLSIFKIYNKEFLKSKSFCPRLFKMRGIKVFSEMLPTIIWI